MDLSEKLAKERRGRLAAERLLEQRTRELFAANEKLGHHARSLSDQIVEQRQVVYSAVSEAESLKSQNTHFVEDLARAHTVAVMAERRMWDSINTIRDGFALFDGEQKLVAANRAYMASFPLNRVAPGIGYAEIVQILLEEDALDLAGSSPEEWYSRMIGRWDKEEIEPITFKFRKGTWVKLEEWRTASGDVVCHALDITERMRIWAAVEALSQGFVLFDRDERLLACNQRYRDMFPDSADQMIPGTTFEELLLQGVRKGHVPEALGREEEWLAERMAEFREARVNKECHLSDGRWILESDYITPDGGRVGLRTDITELRGQQAALETARLAAESANRAKSAFLANMSHEIRTPMNGVVGMAELLCDTSLSEEQRLFAETIRSSGEALLVIINDILDYSKLEAERMTLHPEPFDLERTVHEVTMLLQPKAQAKGLDLMIDFDMFLPTRFVGDPGRLRQVLTNLIGNAVKFTEKGHVLTRVVGMESDGGRQQLHITVEDTGIGIKAENLQHIFGEFNQVEDERNRKFEGTGLGLAITQRLIERMGGAVWVDSEEGKGSSFGFRVTLPLAEDAEAIRPPVAVRRALVVDDQFINRTILERQLSPCGITVVLCRSGAEALTLIASEPAFDVVLTDHQMPEMDGLTLATRLRDAGHSLPVVLLSSSPINAQASDKAGVINAFLQKPVLRAELYRRLRDLVEPLVVEAAPMVEVPRAQTHLRPMRVLAAEDNKTNQLVFQKMVKDVDIELVFANNGREAVELWRSFRPDMIFMDVSMPEMDGKEATQAIRAAEGQGAHVPIVALTAHAMDGDSVAILAAGMDRYLTKPLRKVAISQALSDYCPAEARPVALAEDAA